MQKVLFFIFFLISSHILMAHQVQPRPLEFEKYDWEKEPHLHTLTDSELKLNELILKDVKLLEYAYTDKNELFLYSTTHRIVRLNTDRSIEENNRIYISMNETMELVDLKARTISKTGKITFLDKSNVKDVANFENNGPFKIFAVEGAELGGEIEYIYTLKKAAAYFGTERPQYKSERKDVRIDLVFPENLVFETKCYNHFPDFIRDSSIAGKIKLTSKVDIIPPLQEEKYSSFDADRMRVEYKLCYSSAKPGKRLLTWNDAAETYFNTAYTFSAKEHSKVKELLHQINLDDALTMEAKIRKIECYVKARFVIRQEEEPDFYDVEKVIKNKYGNPTGIVKLYLALFSEAGIDHQLVLTCDRTSKRFDGDFDTWNYLSEYLIYFPAVDNFIAPHMPMTRFGFVPPEWTNNEGLFIKRISEDNHETGTGHIKKIPPPDYQSNYNTLEENIRMEPDFSAIDMHILQSYTGYEAMAYQPVYDFLPEEDKKKLSEALLKIIGNEGTLTNVQVSNSDDNSVLINPFIVQGDLKTSSPIEKAGNKYLLKFGSLIGPQAELYQEDERKTDVETPFNHGYHREITLMIPEGYKITNPDVLITDVFDAENNERTMEFKSSYTLEGQKLHVVIEEDYRKINYPVSKFDAFRKVINASADFNKINLIIQKD
jgi:hypothetical protein